MNRRIFGSAALLSGLAIGAIARSATPAAAQDVAALGEASNLRRILSSKKLRVAAVVGEEPYFGKDLVSGEWSGFVVDMARSIATDLGVELELVETTWGNSVLDLQAGKIDLSFALTPTPARALVIDFSRTPLFMNTFAIVTNKDLVVQSWDELNDPSISIAVDLGSSHELTARRYAGNANIIGFKSRDEAVLAVAAGRADCFVCTIFNGLAAKKKNPQLGNFIMPRPYVNLAVSLAMPYDSDRRLNDFISIWCDFNRNSGRVREWVVSNLSQIGILPDDIPAEVEF